MADSTINGLTELGSLKENDLMIAWEEGAPTNQTKKITAKNARKFLIMEAVCDSAADATTKEIIINANAIPERIAVTFTHGNTAGDTTQQGFTPLTLSIAYNGGSADFDICDSLGNYAGKGFGGGVDGGIIIFQLLSTKALITNSDIRQKETNQTIKSDGKKEYSELSTVTMPYTADSDGILFLVIGCITVSEAACYVSVNGSTAYYSAWSMGRLYSLSIPLIKGDIARIVELTNSELRSAKFFRTNG